MCRTALRALLLLVALLCGAIIAPAAAHEIRPAIAELSFVDDGYELVISVNLEALIAQVGPQHADSADSPNAEIYDRLRRETPAALAAGFEQFRERFLDGISLHADGRRLRPTVRSVAIPPAADTALARISEVVLEGDLPLGTRMLRWAWDPAFGASILRVRGAGPAEPGITYSAYLRDGQASEPFPVPGGAQAGARAGALGLLADYLALGFTHILPKGLDHILFVVGLFLLSTRVSSLVWQISSFTIAHTVTLALGVLGVVQVSPAIVEPLIAASIVYVCVENVLTERLHVWRPVVVFGFGLLHGLGFAGVLGEVGLPASHFVAGLLAFNVGVELGQLSVVAACFLGVGVWFRRRRWYRAVITVPASLVIAAVGAWWLVERTL